MADMIARLKVDSSEYDSKIKRAAQGIQHLTEVCHNAGSILNVLEDENREFIKSLGSMETVSKSARGKIAELTSAFTDLKSMYNSLSAEEKNGEFGKELNKQLEIMKGRIQNGKKELSDITNELNGGSGLKDALNQVAGKFGLNIEMLTKFGGVLGATTAALKVAKDAFFQNESNVDEWGRTVAASEGIYDSFLQSLNNGDFSGFLQRIGEVINKAKEAYNTLDELQTRMTIINPERTKLQARATELKATIRRQGADSEEGRAAQAELRQLEGRLTQAFRTESKLNMNAFKAQVDAKLKNAGITLSKNDYEWLMRSFSSDEAYMSMKRGAKGSSRSGYEIGGFGDEGSRYKIDDRNLNQRLLDLFTDEWRKEYAPLLNAAFSAQGSAASTMLSDARYLREKGGGGGGGGRTGGGNTSKTEEQEINAAIQALTQEYRKASSDRQVAIRAEIKALQEQLDVLKQLDAEAQGKSGRPGMVSTPIPVGPMGMFMDVETKMKAVSGVGLSQNNPLEKYKDVVIDIVTPFDQFTERIEYLKGIINDPPNIEVYKKAREELEKTEKQFSEFKDEGKKGGGGAQDAIKSITTPLNQTVSGISQIAGGIQQLGIEIPEGLNKALNAIQGVSSILMGISSLITVITTIQGVKSVPVIGTFLAGGGVVHAEGGWGGYVPGNKFSGDQIPALLNSGELVLNKFQQEALAGSLKGNGGGGGYKPSYITGEMIWIAANRYTKRTGRGELVTWK